jgi:hypothetical protein
VRPGAPFIPVVLALCAISLAATTVAQANHSLPCTSYVKNFGLNAIEHPPTLKCVNTIGGTWLDA